MVADTVMKHAENWVFLGDSLTEGIGSSRITFVTELAKALRESGNGRSVHDVRLREVDPETFNQYIRVNLAGYLQLDAKRGPHLDSRRTDQPAAPCRSARHAIHPDGRYLARARGS